MDITQRQQVRKWIKETLQIFGLENLESKLVVLYKSSFTRRMGDASRNISAGTYTVRFSIPLWAFATDLQRKETVVHEMCHIIDMIHGTYNSKEAHGYSWSQLMIKCGFRPNRCMSIKRPDELKRNVKRFEATCLCMTHKLTSQMRTKMLAGLKHYRCLKCNTRVSLV